MTISETIDSFTPAKQESLKSTLRDKMGCHEPSCLLQLQVSGGSISINAVLTIPDDGVEASAVATTVEMAAIELVSQTPAALAASLGVPIESVAPVAIQTGVVVPIVVAPPPPSPIPFPPSPASPSQSPPPPPSSVLTPSPSPPTEMLGLSNADGGSGTVIMIVGAGAAVIALAMAVFIMVRCRYKRQRVPKSGAQATSVPASTIIHHIGDTSASTREDKIDISGIEAEVKDDLPMQYSAASSSDAGEASPEKGPSATATTIQRHFREYQSKQASERQSKSSKQDDAPISAPATSPTLKATPPESDSETKKRPSTVARQFDWLRSAEADAEDTMNWSLRSSASVDTEKETSTKVVVYSDAASSMSE